ncbi:MAG: hypothetical protein ACLRPX_09145 [Ruthenibacterium sp.]
MEPMHPYQTEQALAAALARREADAAEQLVREYGGLLNAVVRRHAPGLDADVILADALLAIWQNAGGLTGSTARLGRWWRATAPLTRRGRAHPPGGRRAGNGALAGHTATNILRWSWKICSAACPPRTAPCWAGIYGSTGRVGRRARHQRGRCEHAGGPCPARWPACGKGAVKMKTNTTR